jgi:hypothetical protein
LILFLLNKTIDQAGHERVPAAVGTQAFTGGWQGIFGALDGCDPLAGS